MPPQGTMNMSRPNDPRKPDSCPKCGSKMVATILYGLPMLDEELKRQLDAGEVTLGGCTSAGNDPIWQCVECHKSFGQQPDSPVELRMAEAVKRILDDDGLEYSKRLAEVKESKKPDSCPKCGSRKVASILYGLPCFDEELRRQFDAREVIWGGCTIIPNQQPLWQCVKCYHEFGQSSNELAAIRLAKELDRLFGEQ